MDKSLQDAMEEFLDTTSYDKIPGKWQDVPAEDDNDEESVKSLDILKEWNEADHPRNPAGTSEGGQWVSDGGGGSSSPALSDKKRLRKEKYEKFVDTMVERLGFPRNRVVVSAESKTFRIRDKQMTVGGEYNYDTGVVTIYANKGGPNHMTYGVLAHEVGHAMFSSAQADFDSGASKAKERFGRFLSKEGRDEAERIGGVSTYSKDWWRDAGTISRRRIAVDETLAEVHRIKSFSGAVGDVKEIPKFWDDFHQEVVAAYKEKHK